MGNVWFVERYPENRLVWWTFFTTTSGSSCVHNREREGTSEGTSLSLDGVFLAIIVRFGGRFPGTHSRGIVHFSPVNVFLCGFLAAPGAALLRERKRRRRKKSPAGEGSKIRVLKSESALIGQRT